MKTFVVIFYHRNAQQIQTWQVQAANKFRAGRMFYRKHSKAGYRKSIDLIVEVDEEGKAKYGT